MRSLLSLVGSAAILGMAVTSSFADERADWGRVVAANVEDSTLLLENRAGFQLVVVDTSADVRSTGRAPITLSDIRPGDHVDYAVASWAGMSIADLVVVTPSFRAHASDRVAARVAE